MPGASIPASEFARNFGRYQDRAIAGEIVTVTSHNRVVGAFISPAELERFERLKRRERQSLVTGELPDDVVAAIEAAEYDSPAR